MENLDNRTRAQRWSDNIAEFCGSWGFVFWFSFGIFVWVLLNTCMILFHKFDEYPFILLNLFLTVVSTMQSPIIMMSQNRQVERDREAIKGIHAKLDTMTGNDKKKAVQAVMDLFFALRELDCQPTRKDLVKLAKRIKSD